jgi:hypothetical protein
MDMCISWLVDPPLRAVAARYGIRINPGRTARGRIW